MSEIRCIDLGDGELRERLAVAARNEHFRGSTVFDFEERAGSAWLEVADAVLAVLRDAGRPAESLDVALLGTPFGEPDMSGIERTEDR